jgi:hypothetical protein
VTRAGLGLVFCVAVLAACSVNRKSNGLICERNNDCQDGRRCDDGYCVASSNNDDCPSRCSSCDVDRRTCEIDCDAGNACGDIDCPAGYSCTIKCSGARACGDINCGAGGSCDITCASAGACGEIDCELNCRCDVHCAGSGACGDMACPDRLVACTRDEQPGSACDSSVDATCDLCQ